MDVWRWTVVRATVRKIVTACYFADALDSDSDLGHSERYTAATVRAVPATGKL